MNQIKKILLLFFVLSTLACTSIKTNQLEKMPPPAVFNDETYNPYRKGAVIKDPQKLKILYATTRVPATSEDKEPYYLNQRAEIIHLGTAEIGVVEEGKNWDNLTIFSESAESKKKILLEVMDVKEFGILDSTITPFTDSSINIETIKKDKELFLIELQSQLAQSQEKDVYIYVHGYNVNFENPLLMTAQLWHYMGYRGSFISYGWPSTPKNTAYFKDLDTASLSARGLRLFLDFLAEQDEIENIHILGYSAGTRLVTQALYQKTLQLEKLTAKEAQEKTKLGTVILASSDMDWDLFGSYLLDGQLKILDQMTLYSSSKDKVLRGSQIVHYAPRLGQSILGSELKEEIVDYLEVNKKMSLVDVSNAEDITVNGGHSYFRTSPWVSSDVLLTLISGAAPENRGLVHHKTLPIWTFPPDYIERCRGIIDKMIAASSELE